MQFEAKRSSECQKAQRLPFARLLCFMQAARCLSQLVPGPQLQWSHGKLQRSHWRTQCHKLRSVQKPCLMRPCQLAAWRLHLRVPQTTLVKGRAIIYAARKMTTACHRASSWTCRAFERRTCRPWRTEPIRPRLRAAVRAKPLAKSCRDDIEELVARHILVAKCLYDFACFY